MQLEVLYTQSDIHLATPIKIKYSIQKMHYKAFPKCTQIWMYVETLLNKINEIHNPSTLFINQTLNTKTGKSFSSL